MRRVVIADDNIITLRALKEKVDWARIDAEVVGAFPDGDEALAFCLAHKPDLIVSDIVMPRVDGLELAARVRALSPDTAIVLISAHDNFEYARRALALGVFDYALKPVDYELLRETAARALESTAELRFFRAEVARSLPEMRERFYRSLVKGELSSSAIERDAAYLNAPLPKEKAACLQVGIRAAGGIGTDRDPERYRLFIRDLRRTLERALEPMRPRSFFFQDDRLGLIIEPAEDERVDATIERRIERILSEANLEQQPWTVTIGVGNFVQGASSLRESWEEAADALERAFFSGETVAVSADTVEEAGTEARDAIERDLLAAITQADGPAIRTRLDRLESFMIARAGDRAGLLALGLSVVTRVIFAPRADGSVGADPSRLLAGVVAQTRKARDAAAMAALFRAALERYIGAADRPPLPAPDAQMVARIKEIVERRFSDPGLGVREIAGEVGYSPNYLSAFFKERVGMNLLDYINTRRIECARSLLETTDRMIYLIAEESGFTNQYYFSAIFKRHVGTTPSRYRNSARQG